MEYVIGIDPGVCGAIAILDTDRGAVVWDLPTVQNGKRRVIESAMISLELKSLASEAKCSAWIEIAASMPGQGVASMFSFGRAYGTMLGILAALEIPYQMVSARKWKSTLNVPANKDGARDLALRLFPGLAADLNKKKDQHKAEALLIAEYGRLQK